MARERGEEAGATIGYATRLDSRVGKTTRVIAMTHGVFLSRIQADPELDGVAAVLFDEVHERSLDSDLSLALTLDAAKELRPDLRILPMSATLDGERFARLLGDPPRIESEGRSYPLTLVHEGRDTTQKIEPQMASAIRRAMNENDGSVLAFLPGVAEIERTAEALGNLPPNVVLHRLHGAIEPAQQRAALAPPKPGTRKLVLASAIAETSLTLDHVRIVIDSGLARRPRYDRGAGLTRLVTERASRAAVTQRSGRAARQGPGITIRLWEEAATAALPAHDPPEILEADLSSLMLTCLIWGESDPGPPAVPRPATGAGYGRSAAAAGAAGCDRCGRPYHRARPGNRGHPAEPRLAHMLIEAGERVSRRPRRKLPPAYRARVGGNDPTWSSPSAMVRDRSPRAQARAAGCAVGQGKGGESAGATTSRGPSPSPSRPAVAAARRTGEHWQSVGGRGFRLDPHRRSPERMAGRGRGCGAAAGARILSAAHRRSGESSNLFADESMPIPTSASTRPPRRSARPRAASSARSSSRPHPIRGPTRPRSRRDCFDAVRRHGLAILPWNERALALRQRAAFAARMTTALPICRTRHCWTAR
jgi:ATP-dependent helicase HrpB